MIKEDRIEVLKKMTFEEYRWARFVHDELYNYENRLRLIEFESSDWVWFEGDDPIDYIDDIDLKKFRIQLEKHDLVKTCWREGVFE